MQAVNLLIHIFHWETCEYSNGMTLKKMEIIMMIELYVYSIVLKTDAALILAHIEEDKIFRMKRKCDW